jgi:hypothetical protein
MAEAESNKGTLWVHEGALLRPVNVQTGLTNGSMTEIVGADLPEGSQIVVSAESSDSGATTTRNPFIPQMGNRRR